MNPATNSSGRPSAIKRQPVPLIALYLANAISMVGNVLMLLAVPWFVLQTTGSPEKTGVTGFFEALPIAVAALVGGAVVDRMGYKRASILADLGSGAAIALIPLLFNFGSLEFTALLALVFIGNLLDAPGTTARDALVPDLAPLAGVSLERASSWLQIVERGARLIGAPLAGILIAAVGATNVLWLDALTFLISALIVAIFVKPMIHVQPERAAGAWRTELFDGIRFLQHDAVLRLLVLVVMVTNLLDNGVLLTVYVQQVFGNAVALGLTFAASGGGAVLGALLYGTYGQKLPRGSLYVWLFILLSLRYFVYAFFPPLWLLIVIQFLTGLAAGPLNPLSATVEFERVPATMRGRVFGAITAGAMVAIPLGALGSGFAIERYGLTATMLVVGAIYFVTTGAMLFTSLRRHMNERVTPVILS